MPAGESFSVNYREGGLLYAGARTVETGASSVGTVLSGIANVCARELWYWPRYPLSLDDRLTAWRHGFSSKTFASLALSEADLDAYLSDIQQKRHVHGGVNSDYVEVLENKLSFHIATDPYVDTVPRLYGTIERGEFFPADDCSAGDLRTVLDAEGDLILKPADGRLGRDVYHASRDADGYFINGQRYTAASLDEFVRERDEFVVVEFVQQHEYAAAICPDSTNTIRVLTIREPGTDEISIVRAVHRFGSGTSADPTDNWSGGGCAAPVDETSGVLGRVATYSKERGKRRLDDHPETGTRIRGKTVPHWSAIREAVTEIAELHSANPYVGWDVVLSEDGPVILEGNPAPGNILLQIDEGLLADDRVRAFFE